MYFIVVLVIDAGPGLDFPSPHGEITITAKYSSKQHPKKTFDKFYNDVDFSFFIDSCI